MKTAKYFTATWCGPCKAFKPVMTEIMNEGHSVQILDVDENKSLAQQYNVRSVPTTVIEENTLYFLIIVPIKCCEHLCY